MGFSGGWSRLRRSRAALATTLIAVIAAVVLVLVLVLQQKPPQAAAKAAPSPTPAASHTPTPTPSPTPSLPNTFAYISLQPGDCFDSPAFTKSVKVLTKRACTDPHDAEVTQLTALPDGLSDYPAIIHQALTLCQPIDAAAYRRQSVKQLQYYELYASFADYSHGRHTVTCALSGGSYLGARKLLAPLTR
ncbi:hypothetical protein [Streptacidiphilus rugosus]|uniref:hypothetical protein n=1 Tax=Streptacidiphilus rugosus TaxID=405783 RepID=UPI0012FA3366|nr:hypothetical protein [Streptacidiphilus rugosus]